MEDIIGGLLFFGLIFGLEIAAIVILIFTAIYARARLVVIVCGIVAAVLTAAESILCYILYAGLYANDLGGKMLPLTVSAVSIVSLAIYFPIALARVKRREKSAAPSVA
jgi:hypothetical protein